MPIIYNAATTLNGFLADDHDSLQWLFDVPGADDAEADNQAFLASVDALVMGSTTYEWLLDALDSPAELTAQYGDRPIWVFTSRDLPVPDGPASGWWEAPSPRLCQRSGPRATRSG